MTSMAIKHLHVIKTQVKISSGASPKKFIRRGNCRGKLRAPYLAQGAGGHDCILRLRRWPLRKALKVISAPLSEIFLALNKLVRWHELYQRVA